MASDVNKAFMRAYAKDRQVSPNQTNPIAPESVPAFGGGGAVQNTTQPAAHKPVAGHSASVPANSTRPAPAVQVVIGGNAAPARPVAAVQRPATMPAASAASTPVPTSTSNISAPHFMTGRPASGQGGTQVPQTPVTQGSFPGAGVARPIPVTTGQPRTNAGSAQIGSSIPAAPIASSLPPGLKRLSQPALGQQVSAQASAQAKPMRENDASNGAFDRHSHEHVDASQVWRRLDEAHGVQARHTSNNNPRPTVSVGAPNVVAPTRMQAAAAPPAQAVPPVSRTAQLPRPELPLMGEEAVAGIDGKLLDARRRTVADFLYAAGQVSPTNSLASSPRTAGAPAESADFNQSMPQSTGMPAVQAQPVPAQPAERGYKSAATTMPTESTVLPTQLDADQPARRMGQILRVDIPQNKTAPESTKQQDSNSQTITNSPNQPISPSYGLASDAAQMASAAAMAAAAEMAMATSMTATAPAKMPAQIAAPVSAPSSAVLAKSSQPDSSVTRYVIEQRRLDRAHKLNEAEEKLRRDVHKIFNPVWEVDNLQWPAVVDKLMHQRAESLSHVAAHIKAACQDGMCVLGVTSAEPFEGRTTVACCLARLAALNGINVALVDLDLDHPTLCIQTNMEVDQDWRDCLNEDVTLEEVAVHSIDDQLTVLPLKPRGGRPGLLASDSRIADMLAELSDCFELVIVDCSRTNSSGNVITGLAHTQIFDAAIVVVDRRNAQSGRVEDSVRLIQQTGIESIGIVDNFSM